MTIGVDPKQRPL